jgi:hypothetical protein
MLDKQTKLTCSVQVIPGIVGVLGMISKAPFYTLVAMLNNTRFFRTVLHLPHGLHELNVITPALDQHLGS